MNLVNTVALIVTLVVATLWIASMMAPRLEKHF
jgi:hypothetical protein